MFTVDVLPVLLAVVVPTKLLLALGVGEDNDFFYGHGSSVHVAMPRMLRRRVKQRKTLPQTQNYSHIQQAEVQFHHGSNIMNLLSFQGEADYKLNLDR